MFKWLKETAIYPVKNWIANIFMSKSEKQFNQDIAEFYNMRSWALKVGRRNAIHDEVFAKRYVALMDKLQNYLDKNSDKYWNDIRKLEVETERFSIREELENENKDKNFRNSLLNHDNQYHEGALEVRDRVVHRERRNPNSFFSKLPKEITEKILDESKPYETRFRNLFK